MRIDRVYKGTRKMFCNVVKSKKDDERFNWETSDITFDLYDTC